MILDLNGSLLMSEILYVDRNVSWKEDIVCRIVFHVASSICGTASSLQEFCLWLLQIGLLLCHTTYLVWTMQQNILNYTVGCHRSI